MTNNATDDGMIYNHVIEKVMDAYCNAMSAHFAHAAAINLHIATLQQAVNSLTQTVYNWQRNVTQQSYTNQPPKYFHLSSATIIPTK